ncbi:glycosyltransferase family 4 protein [Pelagibacteraceae bacterium]|nr:glycosyltransferase family 4 protein [Pelagibacteraceae bacterium]
MKKKLLFVVNDIDFYYSHRKDIAEKASVNGYDVTILSDKIPVETKFFKNNINYKKYYILRKNKFVLLEFISFCTLLFNILRIKPDIIHLITLKPIIYGSIISRLLKIKGIVISFTGLGYFFINDRNKKFFFSNYLLNKLLKIGLRNNNIFIIYQNKDDKKLISQIIDIPNISSTIINGSGVNLITFKYIAENLNTLNIIMASRLLKDKGVIEFIESAKILKLKYPNSHFYIAGKIDEENPESLTDEELKFFKSNSPVVFLGHKDNVNELYSNANIIVLPSYREGSPKSLIEASAAGRAIVTTDVPGCRDVVINNHTGILVKSRNIKKLTYAIDKLMNDKKLRIFLGKNGRKYAEKNFSIKLVVQKHIDIYEKLI